jgi:hypothetical protein
MDGSTISMKLLYEHAPSNSDLQAWSRDWEFLTEETTCTNEMPKETTSENFC